MGYVYEYPRPSVTVDLVVLARTPRSAAPLVLLVRRKNEPFAGQWALPGGFLDMGETTEEAALRELGEETGYRTNATPRFLGLYDAVDRDPRGRVITAAYYSYISVPSLPDVEGADDAAEAAWFPCWTTGLAFDHDRIVGDALRLLGFGDLVDARDQ